MGYARSKKTDEELRSHLRPFLEKAAKGMDPEQAQQKIDEFLELCFYFQGQYDSAENMGSCSSKIAEMEKKTGFSDHNRIFYLAIPPSAFVSVSTIVSQAGFSAAGWNRVIVEKPFGRDSASSEELGKALANVLNEDQIYRIDHYLGKEMVQNMIVLRFGNIFLEPLWNSKYISNVIITFKENFGTEGRGGYFDNYGIIRDVMQNHLLQVLSIVAMEPPVRAAGDAGNFIRDEKVKLLRCIPPLKREDVVLGQYVANDSGDPGYLDDETVPKGSVTPTYAAAKFTINNARWEGVPFILRCGKALDKRKAEVRVQFKDPPGAACMFGVPGEAPPTIDRNELVIQIQPDEAVWFKTNVKMPGLTTTPGQVEMDLSYNTRFPDAKSIDAYTRLILDVMRGSKAAFVRDDELKQAWAIFTPLLHQIESEKVPPIPYAYGSRGPGEADEMVRKLGYVRAQTYSWTEPGN